MKLVANHLGMSVQEMLSCALDRYMDSMAREAAPNLPVATPIALRAAQPKLVPGRPEDTPTAG
jgi:hypothetical protein